MVVMEHYITHWYGGDGALHQTHTGMVVMEHYITHWYGGDGALHHTHWYGGDGALHHTHWYGGDGELHHTHWYGGDGALYHTHLLKDGVCTLSGRERVVDRPVSCNHVSVLKQYGGKMTNFAKKHAILGFF